MKEHKIQRNFNPGPNVEHNYDLGVDFGIGRKQLFGNDEQLSGEMLDEEYRKIIQSLNKKTKRIFLPCSSLY